MIKFELNIMVILVILSAFMLVSCDSINSNKENTKMPDNVFIIKSNAVLDYGDLKIGVANIRREKYAQTNGATADGVTAGLFIYNKKTAYEMPGIRCYQGQQISVDGYSIVIINVTDEAVTMQIVIP